MVALIVALIIIGSVVLVLLTGYFLAKRAGKHFSYSVPDDGVMVPAGDHRLFSLVKGEGRPTVVFESGLAGHTFLWWHIQNEIAEKTSAVSYDRAENGWSENRKDRATSDSVAFELRTALRNLGFEGPFVFVAHSVGSLYIEHFARLFPESVAGVVFVDPLSTEIRLLDKVSSTASNRYGTSEAKVRRSRRSALLARLGIKALLRKSVERGLGLKRLQLPEHQHGLLLDYYLLPKPYEIAAGELENLPESCEQIRNLGSFPEVPLKILHHDPKRYIAMLMNNGYTMEEAKEVEEVWNKIHKDLLGLSPDSEYIEVKGSGHSIPSDDPEAVVQAVIAVLRSLNEPGDSADSVDTL